jgi:hypothetical protein
MKFFFLGLCGEKRRTGGSHFALPAKGWDSRKGRSGFLPEEGFQISLR